MFCFIFFFSFSYSFNIIRFLLLFFWFQPLNGSIQFFFLFKCFWVAQDIFKVSLSRLVQIYFASSQEKYFTLGLYLFQIRLATFFNALRKSFRLIFAIHQLFSQLTYSYRLRPKVFYSILKSNLSENSKDNCANSVYWLLIKYLIL